MRSSETWKLRILRAAVVAVTLLVGRTASADVISVGAFGFDELIPGATNVFSITNLTGDAASGGFSLPPDFPVISSLTFTDALLHLVDAGGIVTDLALGAIDAGPLLAANGDPLFALQFAASTAFVSARLTATLLAVPFTLADGELFLPDSSALVVDLLASAGPYLTTGSFATIDIAGSRSPAPVPEPATVGLFLSGALVGAARLRAARAKRSPH